MSCFMSLRKVRCISLIIIALLCMAFIPSLALAETGTSATVETGSANLEVGDTASIPVTIAGVTASDGVGSYEFVIDWNAAVVNVTGVTAGDPAFTFLWNAGTKTLGGFIGGTTSGPTGDVLAANVDITAVGVGTTAISVTAVNALTTGNGDDITPTINNGTITIITTPTADFTADATTVTAGNTVTFTDASTGGPPASWSWNFGDPAAQPSQTASTQGPHAITYRTAGAWDVSLTATNTAGSDTETKTDYITVNPANANSITISPSSPSVAAGGTLAFSGVVKDAYDNVRSDAIAWSVSPAVAAAGGSIDAATGVLTAPTVAGNYNDGPGGVIATVGVVTANVPLDVTAPPVASFTSDKTTVISGNSVTFTDTSTGSPTGWAWDFNNDTVVDSTLQNPTYTFTVPGQYSVKLTVSLSGLSNSVVMTDYITVVPQDIVNPPDTGTPPPPATVPPPTQIYPATGFIPVVGGTVSTPGGAITVTVPRESVPAGGCRITIRPVEWSDVPTLPSGFLAGNQAFVIESDVPLTGPVTIVYAFNSSDLAAAGGDASLLNLSRYDGATAKWQVLGTTVDTTYYTLTATTTQLSTWAVLVELNLPTTGQRISAWVFVLIALAGAAVVCGGLMLRRRRTA